MNGGRLEWRRLGERGAILYGLSKDQIRTLQDRNRDLEFIPCYDRLGVTFPGEFDEARIASWSNLDGLLIGPEVSVMDIPISFEKGPDLAETAALLGIDQETLISRFLASRFEVAAIGFCPGFPYLTGLDPSLHGVDRLPAPRVRVEPGMVGITGSQAGIYPLVRPGGWRLIGQTPMKLVDVEARYFPLKWGDVVRFHRIDEEMFKESLEP